MIPTSWQFGPFARGLDPAERTRRLWTMRAVVLMHCGPRGDVAARALELAEHNDAATELAIGALDRLASLDRRRVLASYRRIADRP